MCRRELRLADPTLELLVVPGESWEQTMVERWQKTMARKIIPQQG